MKIDYIEVSDELYSHILAGKDILKVSKKDLSADNKIFPGQLLMIYNADSIYHQEGRRRSFLCEVKTAADYNIEIKKLFDFNPIVCRYVREKDANSVVDYDNLPKDHWEGRCPNCGKRGVIRRTGNLTYACADGCKKK